jgi:type II secretory ATPase GspE/PulE/Tfp pilus assembly ATPase PilB-like protein
MLLGTGFFKGKKQEAATPLVGDALPRAGNRAIEVKQSANRENRLEAVSVEKDNQTKPRTESNYQTITKLDELPAYQGMLNLFADGSRFAVKDVPSTEMGFIVVLFSLRTADGALTAHSRREAEIIIHDEKWADSPYKADLLFVGTGAFRDRNRQHYASLVKDVRARLGADKLFSPARHVVANSSVILSLQESQRNQGTPTLVNDESSKAIKMFNEIGRWALEHEVSDIHYEVFPDRASVLVRRDGILSKYRDLSPSEGMAIVSAAYNTLTEVGSTKENFNPRIPQNAVIDKEYPSGRVRFRFGSVPVSPDGINVVLRLLLIGVSEKRKSFDQLGYSADQARAIRRAFGRASGVTIIAGTTGSGKSTTLKNAIEGLIAERPHWKFRTIEDPVEYRIDGASQTSVVRNDDEDMAIEAQSKPFVDTLKACLRTDPDFIMVGEVRDKVTAELTLQAAQTGHQVATTVHADTWRGVIQRMTLMGVDAGTLAQPGLLSALIYQTLMPVLCHHCKIPVESFESDVPEQMEVITRLRAIATDDELRNIYVRNDSGCPHCDGKGTSGRTICAEVALVDDAILERIMANDSFGAIRAWREKKTDKPGDMTGRTAGEHALFKMKQGLVSPFHVEEKFKFLDEIGK